MTHRLLQANLITKRQLNDAIEKQKHNGYCVGKNLVDLGYIGENEMTQFIAEEYKIPYVSLDNYEASMDIVNLIPEDVSKIHGLIPIDLVGDILTIGIVDTIDETTLNHIEELTGFKIRTMLVKAGDFSRYIQRAYDLSIVGSNISPNRPRMPRVQPHVVTPSYDGRERRRYPRFNEETKIKYEFKDEYNINTTVNISLGGFLIKSKSPVPLDSHLVVRIELPNSHDDIIIVARVIRVEKAAGENIYLIACCYSSMDVKDSIKLSEYVKSIGK